MDLHSPDQRMIIHSELVRHVVEPCCRAGPEGCGLGSESATFNIGRVIGYRI